jgi:ketosteroid isomerase-like protein
MSDDEDVLAELDAIERAWLEGRPRQIEPHLDPEVVMVLPGFSGRVRGSDAFTAGFVEFCETANIVDYERGHTDLDLTPTTAVASFLFSMTYERGGARWRSTGRDVWVFGKTAEGWRAVWRLMLDLAEAPAVP